MAVHFKFRSAVEFDSVDVEGPSVTLRDLKRKIAEHKKLSGCKDFDLVIAHAETGEEYNDDSVSVPQNTSVIIKRVPAARPKSAVVLPDVEPLVKAFSIKNTEKDGVRQPPSLPIADNNNFADFGVDLYADSEKDIPENYMDESDNVAEMVNKTDKNSERQRQETCLEHQMLENNRPFTAVKSNEMAFAKKSDAIHSTIPNAEVPSELKCSLCQAIFKEAVMIPCCQFSFCRECIRKILIEKGRCPQCNSTKFKIDELLPNIALRQAIEHFLESQVTISNAENCAAKNVPDRESAIQAKAVSQALSNMGKLQRSQSPSATVGLTGKKLNQIIPESAGLSEGKKSVVDNGESGKISKLIPSLSQKDDGITMESQASKGGKKRKKTFRPSATDGTANYVASGRSKKGDHCCYVCGSPDHFARDCPDNSTSFPQHGMFQGGCVSAYGPDAYWHGPSVPHVRPFPNMYGPAPPAMPFEASMLPVAPYGLPPYMPSMYAGVPIHCGFMRMGSIGPALVTPSGRPLSREEFMELQERERWRRLMQEQERERIQEKANSVEDSRRWSEQRQVSEDDHCSSYMKHDVDRGSVGNYSNESNYQKTRSGKHIHKYSREKYPESNAFHREDTISDESDYQTSRSRRHMQRHSREKYIDSNVYQGTNSFSDESDYEKSKSGRHARKQSHEKYADFNGCQREDLVSKDDVDLSFNNRNVRKFQSEKQHGYSKSSKYNSRKHGRHYLEDSMDRSISELEEYGLEPVETCNKRHKDSGHLKVSKHSVSKKSGKTIMLRESGSPSGSYASHHKSRKDASEDLKHVSYHKKDAKKYSSPDYTEEDDRFVSLYKYPSPKEEKLERSIQDGRSRSIHHKKQSNSTSEYDHCLSNERSKRKKKHKNDQRNSLDRTRDTESNVVDDSEVHASRHNKYKSKCHSQPTGSSLDPIEESRWQMNTGFDSENDDMYYIYHTRDKQEHSHKKKAN